MSSAPSGTPALAAAAGDMLRQPRTSAIREIFGSGASAFKIVASYLIGACAMAFCLVTAATQGAQPTFQMLICILGGALGWIFGLVMTPSSDIEKKNFSEFGKTLAALASGFGLAKVQSIPDLVERIAPDGIKEQLVLYGLLFSCTFLIAGLFTYISRLHVKDVRSDSSLDREKAYKNLDDAVVALKRLD